MVILGLLLILLGALAIVAVVFDVDSIRVDLLGAEISAVGLFLLGVGSGVAILWGFGILKFGTKRSLKHRREQKELAELNAKLDRAEADRKDEDSSDHRH
ncbi:MAG: hypothetical protein WKF50_00360 [Nocardioides sp.]